MKRILIILILLTSCGYQPLYSNKDSKGITFREIDLVGDLKINRKLISSLNIEKKAEQYRFEKIVFTSSKQIIETSKNSKGQVDSYKMDLNVVVVIENPDKKVKEKTFNNTFSYKNLDNKFNLSQYEIEVENNLINKIVQDITFYLNF